MNKKGFTLIELLVVIAIIGLLSTLAVFSLNSARTKARDAKRISDMKMLSTAMEMFATEKGSYENAMTGGGGGDFLNLYHQIQYGDESLLDLSTLIDPSNPDMTCSNEMLETCGYTLIYMGTTGFEVCFYLEKGAGNLEKGVHRLKQGGAMSTGCSI